MNRLDLRFRQLRESARPGLIPYITAGHPHPDHTVAVMRALVEGGADVIELGIPFSDVMADGPVIQAACGRALAHGTDLDWVLALVAEFRRGDDTTPVVLMGYMNTLERRGAARFAVDAAAAGADAALIVDCPVEEADETVPALRAAGLHQIFLTAPTTSARRMQLIAAQAGGFLYLVSLKGVTGSVALNPDSLKVPLQRLRDATTLPVAVGFGISQAAQAAAVARIAEAVVIGSALVSALDQCSTAVDAAAAARRFLASIRAAMDNMPQNGVQVLSA